MIRNNIAAVVAELESAPYFLYGTANELNLLADQTSWKNGVVMLYNLKPIALNFTIQDTIESDYSLYLEFLYLTKFDEYTSQNEVVVNQAYWLMKEFLIKLSYYRENSNDARYFRIKVDEKAQSLPVYNRFEVNSTGVNLTLNLEKMTPHNFDPRTRPPGWVPGPYDQSPPIVQP